MSASNLPVAFDALTTLALFERTARVFPDQPAVVYGDTRAPGAEFAEQVGRFAGALARAGVEPGDRVAVLAPNVPVALAAHFAVLRVRGVLVMINTPGGEMRPSSTTRAKRWRIPSRPRILRARRRVPAGRSS
jgi:acyl-CoA synthetase (AMP-forming)/AMP-acid ligase II